MASIRSLTRELPYQPIRMYRDLNTERSIKLDLNSLCIKRPTETFFIQVKNPHLIAWGIELDDLLIVEQTYSYLINDLLVIEKNNEYKFYQFFNEMENKTGQKEKILFSLDVSEPNLHIQDWQSIKIAGVITNVVHQMRHRTAPKSNRKYIA
ncbi:LexA family protein [[Haemophilus] ducreyi]|uniref:LexA family protein n=1 Tax=Haemophilus ducreyi TaxID=730 RepID=UPI000655C178|nr:S24 family peptidase [[Haemophilus] ducreyi]AKO45382.1 transcriptional regulator [[Haemophilus] ducreyi]AKO46767.1 transcriptional regulator [[Haemophilus] ducreyi]AKO48107.1 transcriptional regulator [[Haemophilus] ducreyi]AKO49493.1 transcriptional regulator [[Haemophilus] ducreyi]ANF61470.1 transcriptional regulator [[Haemophilus] ducreyi]